MINFTGMECLTRYELCNIAAKVISEEYNTPDFNIAMAKKSDPSEYEKARYAYVWFCFNEINAPQLLIRKTMLCYKYPKTVYQVIRRMYDRRKDNEVKFNLLNIKQCFNEEVNNYQQKSILPVKEGKQTKLFV